jgi:hypothetical protein
VSIFVTKKENSEFSKFSNLGLMEFFEMTNKAFSIQISEFTWTNLKKPKEVQS